MPWEKISWRVNISTDCNKNWNPCRGGWPRISSGYTVGLWMALGNITFPFHEDYHEVYAGSCLIFSPKPKTANYDLNRLMKIINVFLLWSILVLFYTSTIYLQKDFKLKLMVEKDEWNASFHFWVSNFQTLMMISIHLTLYQWHIDKINIINDQANWPVQVWYKIP